jgi:hypothetical protein
MIDRYTIKFGPAVTQKETGESCTSEAQTAEILKTLHQD